MTGDNQKGLGPSFLLCPWDLLATGKANREELARGKRALQSPGPLRVIILVLQTRYLGREKLKNLFMSIVFQVHTVLREKG